MSSGIWLFEDVAAFIPGLSSGKVCFEDKCSHNAVSSSQGVHFEDEREIPDRVGNDVVELSSGSCSLRKVLRTVSLIAREQQTSWPGKNKEESRQEI